MKSEPSPTASRAEAETKGAPPQFSLQTILIVVAGCCVGFAFPLLLAIALGVLTVRIAIAGLYGGWLLGGVIWALVIWGWLMLGWQWLMVGAEGRGGTLIFAAIVLSALTAYIASGSTRDQGSIHENRRR